MQLPTPCWILSDAHIGIAPEAREQDLLALLDAAPAHAKSLVINGDLFEFWFEWNHVIPRAGFRVVAALARATEAGLPILYIAGNHDCWGGDALIRDAGVAYHLGSWQGQIGPWRAHIDHGDGLRQREDRGYRALRSVLRNRWSYRAFRLLHPDWGIKLAIASSHTSRSRQPRDGGAGLRAIAHQTLSEDQALDLVIHGHSHIAVLERAPNGGIYANPGGWMDDPAFLRIDDGSVQLTRWNGSAEGDRLHVLDRGAEKALPQAEELRRGV